MGDKRHTITLIPGDGIGPECVDATRRLLQAAGAALDWEVCKAGAEVFRVGDATGVPRETIDSITRNHVALKGPLETPVGFGERSANVTLRGLFELYGNLRPTRELPGVPGVFAGRQIDLIVVRENVEDLYAGIEHMQTPGVAQCLKLITRKGCEKITRLAFEVARSEGRKTVHCATKANIMKLTEGLLKRTFEDVAKDYPDIRAEHIIIDNLAHQLVRWPEQYDVIVTTNMNGDIISDLTSGLTGGLGLAPAVNIGAGVAIFEAVHGSAPTIAGKNIANPTAIMCAAVMMMRHLGEFEIADKVEQAIVCTLEDGKALTVDLVGTEFASSTDRYTDAVIANLGRVSELWRVRQRHPLRMPETPRRPDMVKASSRREMGIDMFLEWTGSATELGQGLERVVENTPLRLKMISNRGMQVYPTAAPGTDYVDHWRCRFMLRDTKSDLADAHVAELVARVGASHKWMHIEKLLEIDGQPAFSKAQGES
ncbi:MAG: NADP-dependent isocitrate dehydrogenase [Phycisphaerales bacterium]|nr:NADP-dependent isocitrate dehydrogenase [Phycisphaerales bacterium]